MSLIAIIYKAVFLSVVSFLIMLTISYAVFLYRKKFKVSVSQTLNPQKVSHNSFTNDLRGSVHAEYLPAFSKVKQAEQYYQTTRTTQLRQAAPKRTISHRELRKTRYDILNETMRKPALDYSQSNRPRKYFASSTLDYYREKQVG